MGQNKPENKVHIKSVNHGNVFGSGDWLTFYCMHCNHQVCGDDEVCDKCGTFLQLKEDPEKEQSHQLKEDICNYMTPEYH